MYKTSTINLGGLKKEIDGVKEISSALTKYCDDLKDIVIQLGEAVQAADESQKHKTSPNPTPRKLRKPHKWPCNICKESFRTSTDLIDHKTAQDEGKPFQCTFDNCTKSFSTHTALKVHEKRYTNTKTKMCEKCSQLFFHASKVK